MFFFFMNGSIADFANALNEAMSAALARPETEREEWMGKVIRSDDFFGFASLSARYVCRKLGESERNEAVLDLVGEIWEALASNPGAFRGESKFTTYVDSAIKQHWRNEQEIKAPKAIRDIHQKAPEIYRMIQDGRGDDEIRCVLLASMSEEKAKTLLREVQAVGRLKRIKRNERLHDPLEYDEIVHSRVASDDAIARQYEPEKILEEKEIREVYASCLAERPVPIQALVERCLIQGEKGVQSIGDSLGIKNPTYEIRRFRGDFYAALKLRGLNGPVRFFEKGS